MSFQVPQSIPLFNGPQRVQEDTHWRSKSGNGHANGGVASKLNDLLSDNLDRNLPMYKDKPHFPSSRRRSFWQRKRSIIAGSLLCFTFLWWIGIQSSSHVPATEVKSTKGSTWTAASTTDLKTWEARREAVREAFITSWDGYEKYAWGMDEYHPLSRKGKNMVQGGMGWIIVDALDTAIMMNLTSRVATAREWIKTSLSYTANHDVSTFETTIRMLGGLLSAHWLSNTYPTLAPLRDDDVNQPGEDLYIEKATDLADRLLGAYESPSGIPYASINLNTSEGIVAGGDGGASSTAEAATLQLEMKYLSKLTGEPLYWQKAESIMKTIDAQKREGGLLPIFIYPTTGLFRGENIRLGSRGDSYYEYLIKQYLQTGGAEPIYLDMWNEALEGIKKYLITYTKHGSFTVLAERQSGLHQPLTAKMDHLVCFMPGTIALAVTGGQTVAEAKARLGKNWTKKHDEDLRLAEELTKTCWGMYKVTPTGLAPEIAYFNTDDPPQQWQGHVDPSWTQPVSDELKDDPSAAWKLDYDIHPYDVHNLQRPETIETLFYMYRITRDPKYREWGWEMFQSFRQHTKVVDEVEGYVYAYSSLDTVLEVPVKQKRRRDNMESFWLAETLKYFYLLFSEESFFDVAEIVINTEAHIMPRFDISGSKVWKTGWERTETKSKLDLQEQQQQQSAVQPPKLKSQVDGGVGKSKDAEVKKHAMEGIGAVGNTLGVHGTGDDHVHFDDEMEHGHIEETGLGRDGGHSELERDRANLNPPDQQKKAPNNAIIPGGVDKEQDNDESDGAHQQMRGVNKKVDAESVAAADLTKAGAARRANLRKVAAADAADEEDDGD